MPMIQRMIRGMAVRRSLSAMGSKSMIGRSFASGGKKEITSEDERLAREDVRGLIERASAAQVAISDYSQEQVDKMIKAMVWSVRETIAVVVVVF